MTFRELVLLLNPNASTEDLDRLERQVLQLGSALHELSEQGARALRESDLLELVNGIRSAAESPEAREVVAALRTFGERSQADFAWLRDIDWAAIERNSKPMVASVPVPFVARESAASQEPPRRVIGFQLAKPTTEK